MKCSPFSLSREPTHTKDDDDDDSISFLFDWKLSSERKLRQKDGGKIKKLSFRHPPLLLLMWNNDVYIARPSAASQVALAPMKPLRTQQIVVDFPSPVVVLLLHVLCFSHFPRKKEGKKSEEENSLSIFLQAPVGGGEKFCPLAFCSMFAKAPLFCMNQ